MMSLRTLSLFAAQLAGASENKVYAPGDGSTYGPLVVLYPSAGVPSEHYEPTVTNIQKASIQPIWAVIASTEAGCGQASLQAALDAAASEGWSAPAGSAWLAGHDDSGACAEALLSGDEVAGAIFLGALPGADFDFENAKPSLVLSAELHGGAARPGRAVALWMRGKELAKKVGLNRAIMQKPVVILQQQNNSNFCPGFDMDEDLEGEVDEAEASKRIGVAVGAFLDGIYQDEASQLMGELHSLTGRLMEPFVTLLEMEHVSDGGLDANGSSPFCEKAQLVLSGLSSEDMARLELTDQFAPRLAYDWKEHEDPTGTLMHCHTSVEATPDGKLKAKVCSYAGHDGANSSSSERLRFYDGVAAGEMGCKLSSGDFLALNLNTTAENPNTTCADINTYALQTAQGLLSYEQLKRFQRRGRGICITADTQTPNNVGPLWIFGTTNYTETESCLQVSAFHLKLAVDEDHLPGVEYCKVMSPAFALDYILTSSMKPIPGSRTIFV